MSESGGTICLEIAGRLGGIFPVDVAMTAPMRGVTALFGPSGAGKTTILRAVAGLLRLPGRITVGGEVWQETRAGTFLPPHRRRVGYVFQEASLFPHLDVRANLLYGARRARAVGEPGPEFEETAELLGIADLLDRKTAALSGGERQRVAIGRALLSRPRLLLFDEPLAGVDGRRKDEILPWLERLRETSALPMLYVSHDFPEIERLADRLVLVEGGRVRAQGPLAELQTAPGLPLLSGRRAGVVLEGRVVETDDRYALTRLEVDGGAIWVPGRLGAIGAVRRVRIGAGDVSLSKSPIAGSTILNHLPARVVRVDVLEDDERHVAVILALGRSDRGARIAAHITRRSADDIGIVPGLDVVAHITSVTAAGGKT